jgi:hypothetical protein
MKAMKGLVKWLACVLVMCCKIEAANELRLEKLFT